MVFIEIWVTANLFSSPELLVFLPISAVLWSVFWYLLFPVFIIDYFSRAPTISILVTFILHNFSAFLQDPGIYLFTFWLAGKVLQADKLFSRSGLLDGIGWFVFISKSWRIFYVLLSRTDSDLCIYHLLLWSNSSCIISSGSLFLPSYANFCTLFVLVCCIHLCGWLIHLTSHNISYSTLSYLF